jgi:pimeloyl-ACP methyl ester carboxylesterase
LLLVELSLRKNTLGLLSLLCLAPLFASAGALAPVREIGQAVSQSQQISSRIHLNALARFPLGGMEQTILVQGTRESNPVLLFLHGGPGVPIIPFVQDVDAHGELQKHFVMVYWDQRGAGHSYHAGIPLESMNIAQFLADTRELVEMGAIQSAGQA